MTDLVPQVGQSGLTPLLITFDVARMYSNLRPRARMVVAGLYIGLSSAYDNRNAESDSQLLDLAQLEGNHINLPYVVCFALLRGFVLLLPVTPPYSSECASADFDPVHLCTYHHGVP